MQKSEQVESESYVISSADFSCQHHRIPNVSYPSIGYASETLLGDHIFSFGSFFFLIICVFRSLPFNYWSVAINGRIYPIICTVCFGKGAPSASASIIYNLWTWHPSVIFLWQTSKDTTGIASKHINFFFGTKCCKLGSQANTSTFFFFGTKCCNRWNKVWTVQWQASLSLSMEETAW